MPIAHVYLRTLANGSNRFAYFALEISVFHSLYTNTHVRDIIYPILLHDTTVYSIIHTHILTITTPQTHRTTPMLFLYIRSTDNFKYPIWVCVIPSQNSIYQTIVHSWNRYWIPKIDVKMACIWKCVYWLARFLLECAFMSCFFLLVYIHTYIHTYKHMHNMYIFHNTRIHMTLLMRYKSEESVFRL